MAVKCFFVTSIPICYEKFTILFLFLQVILSDYESGDSIADVNDNNGKCEVNEYSVVSK